MSSPAGPRPGLAPLSRDAPSLRAARKDPSVPSRRCHRAACEDGHTFQPPSPRLGRKAGKQLGVLGFRLPRGVASGGLCPSARGLAGLGPPLPCASSIRSGWACIVSCRSHLVFLGVCAASAWRFRVAVGATAGGGGPLGPGSQGGLRLLQFLCTLRLAGEMWFRAAGWAHRPSCGLDSEACHCHHMRLRSRDSCGRPSWKQLSPPLGVTCLRGAAGYAVTGLPCPNCWSPS